MRRRGRLVEEPQQFPFSECLSRSFVRLLPGRLVGVGLAQSDLSKIFERLGGIRVAYWLSFLAATHCVRLGFSMQPAASMSSSNRRRAASEALELQLWRRTLETML